MPRPGSTLERPISPPPLRRTSSARSHRCLNNLNNVQPTSAAIEAGEIGIQDHLGYFMKHLSAMRRPSPEMQISMQEFKDLYQRNENSNGRLFVVHQHDHPISGVHYDLRLQFSETSSISFAIPYGLPGNPNSARPNRMAIETRVHNLWNHIVESASYATGSLLIWDIGEYEVLPRKHARLRRCTDDETSDLELNPSEAVSQSTNLVHAFQSRYIRLRLHGTKLPQNYTITMRLPAANNEVVQPRKPNRKRRRLDRPPTPRKCAIVSGTESDDCHSEAKSYNVAESDVGMKDDIAAGIASEDNTDDDAIIRANNAYPGASNTIGSVHQRHWFLTLDRYSSGFRRVNSGSNVGRWAGEWQSFFVRGRDHERSVVTGRFADDVMADAGVEKFVGRKLWNPIME